jgi:hypothetical protein
LAPAPNDNLPPSDRFDLFTALDWANRIVATMNLIPSAGLKRDIRLSAPAVIHSATKLSEWL